MKIILYGVGFVILVQMMNVRGMDDQKKDVFSPFPIFPLVCDQSQEYTFTDLVVGDAALLTRLVAQEKYTYCPELPAAQKVIKKNCARNKGWLNMTCGKETAHFVRLIAGKDAACKKIIDAIDNNDCETVNATLARNCYAANNYFSWSEYGDRVTPLHYVLNRSAENSGCLAASVGFIKALLSAGANPNALDQIGNMPMHKAINITHVRLLWRYGARSDEKNAFGCTPLMNMIVKRYSDAGKLLIDGGVMLDGQDYYGNTPLHLAIKHGRGDIIEHLFFKGARVDIRDRWGLPPAHYAKDAPKMRKRIEPYIQRYLWDTLLNDDHEKLQNFMEMHPWMSYKIDGVPILSFVQNHCKKETVTFFEYVLGRLLRAAVRCRALAIDYLENFNRLKDIEDLIESGAPINQNGSDGDCPLLVAVRLADKGIVALLLRHGAIVTQTAIENADSQSMKELLQ